MVNCAHLARIELEINPSTRQAQPVSLVIKRDGAITHSPRTVKSLTSVTVTSRNMRLPD